MKTASAIAFLALLTLLTSCDPAVLVGPQAANADRYKLRATYHQGGCYGRCEVFGLKVYENGLLVYTGERFTDRPGTWERNVDRRRIVGLLDSFERAGFVDLPRSIRGSIPDASMLRVGYYAADGTFYETAYQDGAPKELVDLGIALNRLAHLEGYRQVSDTIAYRRRVPAANKAREEIIVELSPGVRAETWVIAYGKQNVAVKQRVSPNGNYYVITADPNIMGAEELLTYLRQDRDVLSAQKNAAVQPR